MTTLAIRQFGERAVKVPLVQGFVGALAAILLSWAVWSGYGWCRWHLYGRNDGRINALEQNQAQIVQHILQLEAAAKAAQGAK